MTTRWKQIDTWPKQIVVLACICFVILVGLLDYVTGYETFVFTFYLLAIFLGTWLVGVGFGTLLSALSVTAWISANIEAGAHYSSYFVPVWNAAIMFTIYLIIVLLLARLKRIQEELEERVHLRTMALTREIKQRVRIQKELLETADREQRRIGRELHDGLCQHLTGTALAGHLLEQELTAQSGAAASEAARLVELIEQGIEMTRDLSHQLDPVELKSGKLAEHLADLAESSSQRLNVACRLNSRLHQPVDDPAVATHLYRIAQEAVACAILWDGIGRIDIDIESNAFEIALTVSGDGTTLPPARQKEAANHLRIMTFRADLMGAKLNVKRAAERGPGIMCVLPLSGIKNGGED